MTGISTTTDIVKTRMQRLRKESSKMGILKKYPNGYGGALFIGDQNPRDPKRQATWKRTPK